MRRVPGVLRDNGLWLAVAAGPVFWGLLYALDVPVSALRWPLDAPLQYLQLALLYPVAEEIIFRGAVQEGCHRFLPRRAIGALSLANLVTSALFSALHFLQHPPVWAAAVFLPSLVFGYFRDKYGGLTIPIVLHVFYNAGYFWMFHPAP